MIQITTQTIQIVAILISLLSLGVAAWLYSWVKSQPSSNARIAEIGGYIRQGANTFLRREYLILAPFYCYSGCTDSHFPSSSYLVR